MKFTTTYQHLINMMGEIEQMQNKGSVLAVVLRSRFDDFHKHNKIKADSMLEKIKNIEKESFQFEENGQVKVDADNKPIMAEGKNLEDIQKWVTEMMNEKVELDV